MAAKRRITPELVPDIVARAAEGMTGDQIAVWLAATKGVHVGAHAIRKHLRAQRQDREVIAKAVVAEKLSKTLTADIDALEPLRRAAEKVQKRAQALYKAALSHGEFGAAAAALREQRQAITEQRASIETALKLSGVTDGSDGAEKIRTVSDLLALAEEEAPPAETTTH